MNHPILQITLPAGHPAGRELALAMGDLAYVEIEGRIWGVVRWTTASCPLRNDRQSGIGHVTGCACMAIHAALSGSVTAKRRERLSVLHRRGIGKL